VQNRRDNGFAIVDSQINQTISHIHAMFDISFTRWAGFISMNFHGEQERFRQALAIAFSGWRDRQASQQISQPVICNLNHKTCNRLPLAGWFVIQLDRLVPQSARFLARLVAAIAGGVCRLTLTGHGKQAFKRRQKFRLLLY
jgi:hypothetical protein